MAGPAFDDGKDADALRTIGEVSQALGLKPHVLRYWEQQFPMLEPLKRSGGRRYYRAQDVALIQRIDTLVNRQGYTLRGALLAIRDGLDNVPAGAEEALPTAPDKSGSAASAADHGAETKTAVADDLAELRRIRATLAAAIGA